jgi:hypothetical protein
MRMRSVTSRCTRAISALPAAATSAQWNCSSHCATCTVSAAALRAGTSQIAASRRQSSGRCGRRRTDAMHGRGLQHHAQVVQLLELVEVERQHAPAAAKQHLDETFLLQPEQRLPHRRARHAEPLADLVLGEAVAGHQLEFGNVALELFVHLVGARAMDMRNRGGARHARGSGDEHGHGGDSISAWPQRAAPRGRRSVACWSPSSRRCHPGPASSPPRRP